MIDTIVLCGGTVAGGYNRKLGKYVRAIDRPRGPENITQANEHLDWLEMQLSKSK